MKFRSHVSQPTFIKRQKITLLRDLENIVEKTFDFQNAPPVQPNIIRQFRSPGVETIDVARLILITDPDLRFLKCDKFEF